MLFDLQMYKLLILFYCPEIYNFFFIRLCYFFMRTGIVSNIMHAMYCTLVIFRNHLKLELEIQIKIFKYLISQYVSIREMGK